MNTDPREILKTVAILLREIMGDMGDLGPPITMKTSFSADLELESIEFVRGLRESTGTIPSAD